MHELVFSSLFFFFNDTATTEIYTLSLHDALPISPSGDLQERVLIRHHDYDQCFQSVQLLQWNSQVKFNVTVYRNHGGERSEERFSRNAETDLVCRLLLEKKNDSIGTLAYPTCLFR